MAKIYRDENRHRVAMVTLIPEYIELPQESVRAYVNPVKADWRQAGWNLQKHEEVLYNIAWEGLPNTLKNTVEPMTAACGRGESLDKLFDNAAASEVTHVENKKP